MVRRLLVILIVLLFSFNFFVIDNPDSDDEDRASREDPVENPAETDSVVDEPTPVPGVEVSSEPEPVTLVKPGSDSGAEVVYTGSRGIWNWTGSPMFVEDFEGSFPGPNWHAFDNLSNASNRYSDFWGLNNSMAHNGSWSVYCSAANATGDPGAPGNYSVNHSGYDDNIEAWMITGPFNLSGPEMLNARVTFWYWMQTEIAGDNENDSFIWAASKDNKTYRGLRLRGNFSSQWNMREYYLDNYDNQGGSLIGESQVWLAFIFTSNDNNTAPVNYNYTGVWLDDVLLENYTNRAPGKPTSLNVTGPNDRRIILDKPVFNWTFNDPDLGAGEGPSGYHIQISSDDDWTFVEKWNKNVTGYYENYVKYGSSNKLEDGKTYWIRVKVRDMDGLWSHWSDTFNFSMNDPPSEPTVISPKKDDLWEGGTQHYINWTVSTNDDNGTDDVILINLSYSINGGLDYTLIIENETNDGSYLWTLPNTVESRYCRIMVTAFDGYEETSAMSYLFWIDSLVPVINNVIVTSDRNWYYVIPGMNHTGGTVWFNSLPGEGGDQNISVFVDWTDVSPTSLEGSLAFGDTPKDNDSAPDTVRYTVDINSTDQLGITIKAVDYFGRSTEATIDFLVDNVDPTAPTNVVCRPDSFVDSGEVDNDNQIFVTYTSGTDADVGIWKAMLDTEEPPDQTANTAEGQGLVTSYQTNLNVTIFVAMVDFVGNMGPTTNDTIKIDLLPPVAPKIFSKTHPDNTKYYNDPNPAFNWTWPVDLSGVEQFAVKLNEVSSYIPDPAIDTVLSTNFTSYTGVSDGVNFFHVRSYDKAGFWGLGSSSFKFFIDTQSPYFNDFSDTGTTTGDKLVFKVQALDTGSGVDNTTGKLYWRYSGDPNFKELTLPLVNDLFLEEITTDEFRSEDIEYYFTIYDTAVPPNMGRYPVSGVSKVRITDNKIPWIVSGTNNTAGTTGDPVNISVRAGDNVKPTRAILYVDGWTGKYDMAVDPADQNNFSTQIILPLTSVEPLKYYIEVYDGQNNMVRSPSFGFHSISVTDNDSPWIKSVTGNLSKRDEFSVTVTVIPEDNVETALVLTAKFYSKRTDALFSMVPIESIQGFQYVFELSSEIKSDVDYYIWVEDTSGNGVRTPADEDGYYHIYVPAVLDPNGGEIWNKTREVRWHAPAIPGETFEATLSYTSDDGESWTEIFSGIKNAERYPWDTTDLEDGQSYRMKLELFYSNGFYMTDISDNDFIIYNPDLPSLAVKYPKPGDRVRSDVEVQWESTDPDPMDDLEVDIFYQYLGKGTNVSTTSEWKILVENQPGTGSYIWQTLKFLDGKYKLRFVLTDKVLSPVTVEVDSVTVYNPDPPMISVLTPKTNEVISGKYTITWIATDADDEDLTISLYLRRVTDKNQTLLKDGLDNTGIYEMDFSKYKEGIYEIVVVAYDGSVLEPQQGKSGVFDIEHEEELNLTTWIIVLALIAFAIIVLLMLFIMARQRKRTLERAKLKKEAQIKKREGVKVPGYPMAPGMGLPGMPAPGMMGMPQQLPMAGYQYAPPGFGFMPGQLPQLPPTTAEGMEPSPEDVPLVEGEIVDIVEGTEGEAGVEAEAGAMVEGEVAGESYGEAGYEPSGTETFSVGGIPAVGEVAVEEPAAPPVAPVKPKKRFCGECGAPLGEADVVCVQCGRFQQ